MALVPARIDLWTVDLAGPAPSEALLSPAERARADRFRFARDRHRYLVAHDAMRRILGAALGVAPGALVFDHGPQGKPALAGSPGVHFNLSHSEDLAVLAVTTRGPIGVDVEAVRPIPEF
nr:hypothetical protein [Gemmatimonadaceae bacterium]